ncbi:MAG: trimethylamine methyltransferase family protein, partial [Desulfobacteraceae bacterium]|nr:trimethylamine methyltransferase family protein [Desulfobacteraceae bacterium]
FGGIGCSIHQVMTNQIWRRYRVPRFSGGSGVGYTASKSIDFQNAYERAIGLLLNALSGTNFVCFMGAVYGELTWSPIQAILDDDIAGMIGRFIDGVEVNDDTMAIDLINEVGPIPGFYLNQSHTRDWWHKEQFVPRTADRLTYPEWMNTGRKNCLDYARERMEEILATNKVSPTLTPSQEEDIEKILNEARQYYRKRKLISDAEWEAYLKDLKSPDYPYA